MEEPLIYTAQTFTYAGVPKTIATMRAMIRSALTWEQADPVRRLVEEIIAKVRAKDYLSEIAAIHYWVLQNVRYTRDPIHVERVTNPLVLLSKNPWDAAAGRRAGQEDCESIATTEAAMTMSIGSMAEFVTISMQPSASWHHVFTVCRLPDGLRVVLDPVPGPQVAQMLRGVVHWKRWPIEPIRRRGLAGFDVPDRPVQQGIGRLPGLGLYMGV